MQNKGLVTDGSLCIPIEKTQKLTELDIILYLLFLKVILQ